MPFMYIYNSRAPDPATENPHLPIYLTTCFVCKEEAKAGEQHTIHYGGIVCLSCRAFFRRSNQATKVRKRINRRPRVLLQFALSQQHLWLWENYTFHSLWPVGAISCQLGNFLRPLGAFIIYRGQFFGPSLFTLWHFFCKTLGSFSFQTSGHSDFIQQWHAALSTEPSSLGLSFCNCYFETIIV